MRRKRSVTMFALCVCSAAGLLAQSASTGDLQSRTTPAWFDEAKLGIFIHWNAAAIPAYAPVTSKLCPPMPNGTATPTPVGFTASCLTPTCTRRRW